MSGTFDGFYAFVAEARGAKRVVAIDSEQHVEWVRARWGSEAEGGEGFRDDRTSCSVRVSSTAVWRRQGSTGWARRSTSSSALGSSTASTDPLGLLRLLRARLADDGRVLLETYGIEHEEGNSSYIRVHRPGDVYADDEFVYWGFGAEALRRLAELAGFTGFQLHAAPIIDGHPRIIASLTLAGLTS